MDADRDPAAVATAAPEPPRERTDGSASDQADGTEPVVHAVGIGPGPARYRTAIADRLLAEADVVVGFETVLEYVEDVVDGDLLGCDYRDQTETLATFGERVAAGQAGVAAFMGDPNVSGCQFLGRVERAVGAAVGAGDEGTDAAQVRVVPGVSSIQLAASRAGVPFEHATFASLHRRGDVSADLDRLRRDVGDRHLVVLPRPYDQMPGDVAAELLDAGASGDLPALVYERLAHADEERTAATLAELVEHAGGDGPEDAAFSDLSVLVVRRPDDHNP